MCSSGESPLHYQCEYAETCYLQGSADIVSMGGYDCRDCWRYKEMLKKEDVNLQTICNNCGKCCQWLLFNYPNTEQAKTFLKTRGFRLHYTDKGIQALLHHPCPKLRPDGKDKFICSIYKDRPEACKISPCPKKEGIIK